MDECALLPLKKGGAKEFCVQAEGFNSIKDQNKITSTFIIFTLCYPAIITP